MKNILSIITLCVVAFSASALSLDKSALESVDVSGIAGIAESASDLLSLFDEEESVSNSVDSLLGGLKKDDALSALSALQGLASLDFSKEQLGEYGKLLSQVAPMLLAKNFDLENGEIGQYVGKAIELLESEDFASASAAVSKALEYVDTDSLQQDLLNGLVKSYAPMLEGLDLDQAVELGKSVVGGLGSD